MPTASILGSRGCPWDCSFCSIRPFYEEQGGSLRRLRAPKEIVAEMIDLHRNRGVPIFLFQDDDFLAGGKKAQKWAMEIADLIAAEGLAGEMAFKISCRSDEIHPESNRTAHRRRADARLHGRRIGRRRRTHKHEQAAQARGAFAGRPDLEKLWPLVRLRFHAGRSLFDVPQHSSEREFSGRVHRRRLDGCAVLPDVALRGHADQTTTRVGRATTGYFVRSRLQIPRSQTGSFLRLDGQHLLREKLHQPGAVPHLTRIAL